MIQKHWKGEDYKYEIRLKISLSLTKIAALYRWARIISKKMFMSDAPRFMM